MDEGESQEAKLAEHEELSGRKALLATALKTLNERERHILIEHRLKDDPATLEELSTQYGISRERVRQIEVRAFEKVQKSMTAKAAKPRRAAFEAARTRRLSPARTERSGVGH
jgi:RNA polymerase sigma-32 factor